MALQRNDEAASRRGEPAYRLTRRFQDGAHKHFLNVDCRCGEHLELGWALGNEPTKIAKKMRALGWGFEPFKKKLCMCPACYRSNKKEDTTVTQDNVTPIAAAMVNKPAAQPRVLSPPEKQRVRALLDGNFDDATGRYLAGWSDQRIGTELDVPWSRVAELREMAYGPLKEDPRLDQLRVELTDLKTKAALAHKKWDEIAADLERRINAAETKLADIVRTG